MLNCIDAIMLSMPGSTVRVLTFSLMKDDFHLNLDSLVSILCEYI